MTVAKKIGLNIVLSAFMVLLAACGGETPDRTVQQSLPQDDAVAGPVVVVSTNKGDIEIELDEKNAPLSTANFLAYTDSGHYNGTIFHRVIAGFMIQGGGFTDTYDQKPTMDPIQNEATNGLKNVHYSIAMARTGVVHSGTSQFFINVADNVFLDHRDTTDQGYGYAVFGRVVAGEDIVDSIAAVKTGSAPNGRFRQDVPIEPVVIQSVTRK